MKGGLAEKILKEKADVSFRWPLCLATDSTESWGHVIENQSLFTSHNLITMVMHCSFVPHYLLLGQHALQHLAETKGAAPF